MNDTERRKDSHISICLEHEAGSGGSTGLRDYRLTYQALPELNLDSVDLRVTLFGRELAAPLIIGAMTGGTPRGDQLNARLARAAEACGVGLALGSQRAMIERPETADTYDVRRHAPGLPLLLGNIGAVQFNYGVTAEAVARALRHVRADALAVHLNPLQEAVQPEGQTRFAGLRDRLLDVLPRIPVPSLVKEVGAGISEQTALLLRDLPIAGIEVAGVGGTSWAEVEALRAADPVTAEVGHALAGFGIPTAASILNCRRVGFDRTLIASGGIRTGLDVATAIALGADAAALARPLLVAAERSEQAVVDHLRGIIYALRVVMFCTGCADVNTLRTAIVRRREYVDEKP